MNHQDYDLQAGLRPVMSAVRRVLQTGAAAATVTVLAAPYAGIAQAQGAAATKPREAHATRTIDEVLVTARRREESAQSVPIAINVFDPRTLQDFHIENMEDLQTIAPSLTVSAASGRPNSPVYSLRGVRPTENLYGQDPTVAIYFADVVLSPAKGSNLGMYDLASVQVLKGPQGTLFGRNTTGGAILLTPQRPGDAIGGDVMVGFGNLGLRETQLDVDFPVAENFAVRLSGRATDSDGYQTNVAPGPLDGDELGGGSQRSGRLSAVWKVSEHVENYTILTWDDMEMDGRAHVLEAVNPVILARYQPAISAALARAQGRDVNEIESDLGQTSEVDVWGIFNTTTADLGGDLTLKSIIGYRDLEAYEVVDLDATAIPELLSSDQTTTLEHGSYELQLLGQAFDDRLDWVTGLYSYYEDGVEDSPGYALGRRALQTADIHNISYSVFAQGTYQLASAWSITAGARWTYDDKEMTIENRTLTACSMRGESGALLPLSECQLDLAESFDQPTGTVSLEYAPTDNMLFYVASRLGYRAGGFNARASTVLEREPFDPETVTDLELGSKIDWFAGDWHMRSNVAIFQQWYDDIQRTVGVANPAGIPGSSIQNAAEAETFGVEIEQTIAPTENLSFTINYTYTDPEYKKWEDPVSRADLSDTPFHFTPDHAASISAVYTYPLADNAGVLRLTAGAYYLDDVWINALQTSADMSRIPKSVHDTMQQEAYWLYNLGASWDEVLGSRLDISAYVRNLTDEEYTLGGIQLYHRVGLNTKVYGEPRTYGMQFRYRF